MHQSLTSEQVKNAEANPEAIEGYAAGYQAGRLHSLARIADVNVWVSLNVYALGYRHGWYVEGRVT